MNTAVSHPIAVTNESFTADVLEASHHQPVLVDFWAAWCGPCRAIAPALNELAAERAGQAVIAKVDVDASPELASHYGIHSIPTLLFFRDGEVVGSMVGVWSKQEIRRRLDEAIAEPRAVSG